MISGNLLLLLAGDRMKTLAALNVLRLEMGDRLGLRDPGKFAPLWVVDFPLLEWDEETKRFYAMHHPFTSPKPEDVPYLESDPGRVRQRLRLRGERYRGGRRLDTYFRQRTAKPAVRDAGLLARGRRKAVRIPDERFQIRRTAPRGHRFRV